MNNNCDNVWFGKENVFNTETEQGWITAIGKIEFPKRKRWQRYVDSKRLEITCGEAPTWFLVMILLRAKSSP